MLNIFKIVFIYIFGNAPVRVITVVMSASFEISHLVGMYCFAKRDSVMENIGNISLLGLEHFTCDSSICELLQHKSLKQELWPSKIFRMHLHSQTHFYFLALNFNSLRPAWPSFFSMHWDPLFQYIETSFIVHGVKTWWLLWFKTVQLYSLYDFLYISSPVVLRALIEIISLELSN